MRRIMVAIMRVPVLCFAIGFYTGACMCFGAILTCGVKDGC